MNKQSVLTPTTALIITNIYVLLSLIIAFGGSRQGTEMFDVWILISPILTGLFAVGAALLAARASDSGHSRSWQVLCAGLGLWTLAELLWAFRDQTPITSTPNWSDWLWVIGYIPVGAAIQLQLNQSRAALKWFKVIFAILVGVALACLFTLLVLSPMYQSAQLGRGLTAILNLLYPSLDITLVIGSLLVLQSVPGSSPWRVVAIALLFWVYADLGYAVLNWLDAYGMNGISLFSVEIPYNLAYLLTGVACLQAVSVARHARASEPGDLQPAAQYSETRTKTA